MSCRWRLLPFLLVALLGNPRVTGAQPVDSAGMAEIATAPNAPVPGIYDGQPIARAATTRPEASSDSRKAVAAPQLDSHRIAMALAIVLAIIFVLVWLYRRIFGGQSLHRGSSAMKVLSRMAVTPKQHVLLLQVGRRVVVVADNGAQMTPLSQIEDPDEVALLVGQVTEEKAPGTTSAFGSWFGRARGDYEEPSAEEPQDPHAVPDDEVQSARGELSGLMEKVRFLSQQFRRTS